MTERRTALRYEITLPVSIQGPKLHARPERKGKTRNFSSHGILFTVDQRLSIGTELDFTVLLSSEVGQQCLISVHLRGEVVRIEERTSRVEVAVRIQKYEIVRSEFDALGR